MTYFELIAAMNAKAPVIVRIHSPSYSTVIVGKVVGVAQRIDDSGKPLEQADIKERGTNSITIASFDAVEPLYET